ncbi:hypothetical protein DOY81_008048, partial [Sarcophaga bullata]
VRSTFILLIVSSLLSNVVCCTLNDTHALILARGGSKGIINKNLLEFNGETLIGHTIKTINRTGNFANIWVSTDSDAIEREALKYNALVYRRLAMFADDHSSSLEAVKEFLITHTYVIKFALFQCTSIFLKESYILEAYHKFNHYPCVFAVTRSHKLRWKRIDDDTILPLNFNVLHRPRRQDWEGELIETGMFYFSNRELIGQNVFQNYRCAVVEIDARDAIEIDSLMDLKMAQCLLH